jgi:hypothetical protein
VEAISGGGIAAKPFLRLLVFDSSIFDFSTFFNSLISAENFMFASATARLFPPLFLVQGPRTSTIIAIPATATHEPGADILFTSTSSAHENPSELMKLLCTGYNFK